MMPTETTLDLPTRPATWPAAPNSLADAGLSLDLVTQLVLKHLHFSGELKGADVGVRLGVNFSVVEPALEFLKNQRQVEVGGGAITGAGSYRYRITDAGRTRVALFLQT